MLATKTNTKEKSVTSSKPESKKGVVEEAAPQIQLNPLWHGLATHVDNNNAAGSYPAQVQRSALADAAIERGELGPADELEPGGHDTTSVQQIAAQGVATGGRALPHLERIQASFGGHDVSSVRAHVGGQTADAAGQIGALAYATGNSVAFAQSPDVHMAAHEAAHVVQQRGGIQLKGGVGKQGDAYEQHADAVADAVVRDGSAETLLDESGGSYGGTTKAVQRFDAGSGGHQGMERTLAGLDPKGGLGQPGNLKNAEPRRGTRKQGANAIYSGNFMQDFSQMHAPFVHNLLTNLPKRPMTGKSSPVIGHAGSEAITNSIIRALAILDVGPTLADEIVAGNMQAYRPEQHVDQPQGYAANTDSIVHDGGPRGPLRPGRRTVQGGSDVATSKFALGQCKPVKHIADPDRDRDLAGSAAPGRQFENPELFKVSDAGLQNHIYNSAEWCKNHWLSAARLGPTDKGRFHIGSGLHAIEDYFSHSNFIEVALNGFIESALKTAPKKQSAGTRKFLSRVKQSEKASGKSQQKVGSKRTHVDTLFDASAPKRGGHGKRQAVTTGSVSGIDMKGSIGHILLPKAPMLQDAIDGTIEKVFGLVVDAPDKVSSWDKLKKLAKSDRPMAAVLALGEGADSAGMTLPVPTGVALTWDTVEVPVPFYDNPSLDYPDGARINTAERPVTSAVGSYIGFVKSARETLATIQKYIGYAKYFGPAGYAIVTALRALIKQINGWIDEQLELVKQRIKQQLMLGLVALIDSISGVDSRDQKDRTIGDALADIDDRVEGFEHQTSLEARLLPGGDLAGLSDAELGPIVGPVRPAPGGGWVAVNPLAPSHSEISKDHARYTGPNTHAHGSAVRDAIDFDQNHGELLHPDQHQSGVKHDHADGSIFGGLARALATEADRHVLRQAEIVWQDRGSLYGDSKALDTSTMEVDHDSFGKQADKRATAEAKRAENTGYKFAQTDAVNATLMSKPGVRDLLDLVDLIIAHPEDSTWWKTVAQKYISANPDEVARHIRERNAVRGQRRRISK